MRILHTYKSTNNGKFCDMPEKDAGGGRETGNLFGVALEKHLSSLNGDMQPLCVNCLADINGVFFFSPHRENSEEAGKTEMSGDGVEQPPAATEAGEEAGKAKVSGDGVEQPPAATEAGEGSGEDSGPKDSEDKQEDDET